MKNILKFTLLFLLLTGCDSNGIKKEVIDGILTIQNPEHGLWQNEKNPPLTFELEQSYGKENEPLEELFVRIKDVFTDLDQNIYILDAGDNRLLCFTADGHFLWSKGQKGKGPGEFIRARNMAFDGQNYLYLCSSGGRQIDRFDLNGNYQARYDVAKLKIGSVNLNGFIKPNILVVSRTESRKSGIKIYLLEIEESLKIKTEIDIFEHIGIDIPQGFSTAMEVNVSDETIRVANLHKYEFKYFNIDGKLIKKITRDFHKLVRPGIVIWDDGGSIRWFSYLSAPMKLFDNYQISFSYWPTNVTDPEEYLLLSRNGSAPELKFMNMIDLLNSEGELLYSIYQDNSIPDIGKPIYVDSQGKVYTVVYEPFPQVRRYKLTINK